MGGVNATVRLTTHKVNNGSGTWRVRAPGIASSVVVSNRLACGTREGADIRKTMGV